MAAIDKDKPWIEPINALLKDKNAKVLCPISAAAAMREISRVWAFSSYPAARPSATPVLRFKRSQRPGQTPDRQAGRSQTGTGDDV
jgi:hypothetical protein